MVFWGAPLWQSARGDSRNSGAYPLAHTVTPAGPRQVAVQGLQAFPNPGSGRIAFRGLGAGLTADTKIEIFDLRGRRLRQLQGADSAGLTIWDGTDERGRPLATGTYLAVARTAGRRLTTRLVLTR